MQNEFTAYNVLRARYPEKECVLLQEVSDASGHSRSRSMDFMVINLWNSRGLAVTGIEKKTNRGDWLKELKTPEKQENHFKHCDYFYLLTDKEGVAKLDEIPVTWGWYHITEKGILKTLKPAPKLNPIPIGRSLLCAMLRRAADKTDFIHLGSMESQIEMRANQLQESGDRDLRSKAASYETLKNKVDEFLKFTGIDITRTWGDDIKNIGGAVDIIKNNQTDNYIKNLERFLNSINEIQKTLINNIELLKPEK